LQRRGLKPPPTLNCVGRRHNAPSGAQTGHPPRTSCGLPGGLPEFVDPDKSLSTSFILEALDQFTKALDHATPGDVDRADTYSHGRSNLFGPSALDRGG